MREAKVTGKLVAPPLVFTSILGWMDGKRKGVVLNESGAWEGHYLTQKSEVCKRFVHSVYTALEKNTADMRKDSSTLALEYIEVTERLRDPDQTISGATASMRIRSAARAEAVKPKYRKRLQDILQKLAEIDETLIKAVGEAAGTTGEAEALISRRVQAYLRGASLALKKSSHDGGYTVLEQNTEESVYYARHAENDRLRKQILNIRTKEVMENEAEIA